MPVNNPFALTAGIQYTDGTASTATSFTGTVAMSFNASNAIVGLRSDASDNLLVNVAAFTGTVGVVGTLTHNAAVPAANNIGALVAVASSAAPTYNAGDQVLLSTDLAGNLRVSVASVVATNNITEWANVLLGAPTTYGTAPTGNIVIGVNAFVTNTVPVSQSGSWTVAATQSGTWNVGVTGTVAVTQSTSPWVVSLTSTTVTNTVAENLTQVAGTTLGATAVTNFGTAPAAAAVPGVNASIYAGVTGITATGSSLNVNVTNTVPVTLTSTTITGTVAVTQSTSPWTVQGDSASGAANAGNPVKSGAVFNTTQPTVTNGQTVDNQATARGALIVATGVDAFNVANTGTFAVQAAQSGTWTTTVTQATAANLNATVVGTGTFAVQAAQSGTWTVQQGGAPWSFNLTQLNGTALGSGTNWATAPATSVNVQGVNAEIFVGQNAVSATNPVPVSATAAANTSGNPIFVSAAVTGTVAVTQSTSPWVVSGGLTHNNAAPAANNVGVLPAVASTAAPTYTTGDQVLLSTDLAGNLRVTFAAASEQNVNLNQWAGTNLGTPTTYGTSPGAVVAGSVNAFVTNTVAVTLASTTITGTVAVTQSTSPWVVAGALTNNNAAPTATLTGVLPAIAETAYTTVTYTTGDLVLPVTDLHGALNQDLQAVAGTALGATAVTNFGTAPAAANVPGVNASIYAGTTGLTAAAKGTQGTNALTVQEYKDSGRTYVTLFADAVNSTITDALITFQYNKGGTVTTGVTNYQVTAGKTLRIQSISVAASASGSTVQCKFRVRSGAATLSATSPILWGRFQASNASLPGESTDQIPDGLEIAAGQQIGISGIQLTGSAGNTQWTISIVGYEY